HSSMSFHVAPPYWMLRSITRPLLTPAETDSTPPNCWASPSVAGSNARYAASSPVAAFALSTESFISLLLLLPGNKASSCWVLIPNLRPRKLGAVASVKLHLGRAGSGFDACETADRVRNASATKAIASLFICFLLFLSGVKRKPFHSLMP